MRFVNVKRGKFIFISTYSDEVISMEKIREGVRNRLKEIIASAVSAGVISAPLLIASPYIAILGVPGAIELFQGILERIFGEGVFRRVREKLGVREYSERDVREIFEIAKGDEEVRKVLVELMNELLDRELLEELGRVRGSLEALSQAVEELKAELPDIESRLRGLEGELRELREEVGELRRWYEELRQEVSTLISPKYVNEEELIEELKVGWVRERKPVVSPSLRRKVEEAVNLVKGGEKVCIIGEAGIGKTTALYLACSTLLKEGLELRTSGIEGRGVFVVDDLGAREGLLDRLENCSTAVIASARDSEWRRRRRWHEIRIDAEDQRPKLREMFISMLKARKVRYNEGAVEEILRRNPTPVFLSLIADRFEGREITEEDASEIPEDVYEYVARVIRDCGDDLAVAILYCVAKTKSGRLHRVQLDTLRDLLRERVRGLEGDGRYEALLEEFDGSFGIKHDVWRDLITLNEVVPKEAIELVENLRAMRIMRYYDTERLIKEACRRSLESIEFISAGPAAILVKRALENFPDLSEYAFNIALRVGGDKRDLILDVIAMEAPEPLMELQIEEVERLAYEVRAPNAGIVLFGRLTSHYGKLAERDERFLPDLAMTLNNLGVALARKGRVDEAIEMYEEALKLLEPLSDMPWLWGLISKIRLELAFSLLLKGNIRGAVEHLCTTIKLLTDERAPMTFDSEQTLISCVKLLKDIEAREGESIPEDCRKLMALRGLGG